ncbi:MAG: hypothetical protein U0637_02470 [Phycisphaerales bacterium]
MPDGTLDGVRPRHVACPRCGYHPDGVPIAHGAIPCPECGHAIRFELPKPAIHPRIRTIRTWIVAAGALLLVALGVTISWHAGTAAGGLYFGAVIVTIAVSAGILHLVTHRPP